MWNRMVLACMCVAAAACSETTARVAVASVAVSPASMSVLVGATTQLTATAKDASGVTLTDREIAWASLNPSVVSVDQTGTVTGMASGGPVLITATSEGKVGSGSITVTAPDPCDFDNFGVITLGQTITNSLGTGDCLQTTGAFSDFRILTLSGTTSVRIEMSSSTFDAFLGVLRMVGPDLFEIVASDDDSGPGLNSLLNLVLPAGTYVLLLTSFDADAGGPYQVTVTQTSAQVGTDMVSADAGQRFAGRLTQAAAFIKR